MKNGSTDMAFAAAPMGELAALGPRRMSPILWWDVRWRQDCQTSLLSPLVQGALSIAPLRNVLGRDSGKPPIVAQEPKEGWHSQLWAEARNARGDRALARIDTGEGYASTAHAALANVEALSARKLAGAFTPARAFGAGMC